MYNLVFIANSFGLLIFGIQPLGVQPFVWKVSMKMILQKTDNLEISSTPAPYGMIVNVIWNQTVRRRISCKTGFLVGFRYFPIERRGVWKRLKVNYVEVSHL